MTVVAKAKLGTLPYLDPTPSTKHQKDTNTTQLDSSEERNQQNDVPYAKGKKSAENMVLLSHHSPAYPTFFTWVNPYKHTDDSAPVT